MIPASTSSPTRRLRSTPGARARLEVTNRGDRPVQVGSHCHFFEVNRYLSFDRPAAYGMRLNVAAGTAVRFEPGDTREVELVALGGTREVYGLNSLVNGALDDEAVAPGRSTRCGSSASHEIRSPQGHNDTSHEDRTLSLCPLWLSGAAHGSPAHPNEDWTAAPTPITTGRRPATASAWRIPSSWSRSSATRRSTATRRSSAAARSSATAWASRPERAGRADRRTW